MLLASSRKKDLLGTAEEVSSIVAERESSMKSYMDRKDHQSWNVCSLAIYH